jgi:Lar family restriction alleviation protein
MSHQPTQPCPFCGSGNISDGEVLTADVSGKTSTQSMCNDCGAFGPAAHLEEGEIDYGDVKAIAAWNARAIASVKREPLSEPVIQDIAEQDFYQPDAGSMDIRLHRFARAIEQAHGITATTASREDGE